jgi:hypothetical protein
MAKLKKLVRMQFRNLSVGSAFVFIDDDPNAVFIKTEEGRARRDMPQAKNYPFRDDAPVSPVRLELAEVGTLLAWWADGHEEYVAEQVGVRAKPWQAVLVGVKIGNEFGEGAGRMLADLIQEMEGE